MISEVDIDKLGIWAVRGIELAQHVASYSKDPSTQVGAVIMRPDKTIASIGYNGFPRGVLDTEERYADRPTKYALVVHAEANAIVSAREPLHGMSMYCSLAPCSDCTGLIIQAGIRRVIAPAPTDEQYERWSESFRHSESMFTEAGVHLVMVH